MSRKRHSVDQIIGKLRQADVELGQGKTDTGRMSVMEHGRLSVYLDGKLLLARDETVLALTLRNSKADLLFGAIKSDAAAYRNRTFNGVIAAIEVYDHALGRDDVGTLWDRQQRGSVRPDR